MQRICNVKILFYGENANGFSIEEKEILDLNKFKNVPVLKNIESNYKCGKTELIGLIEEATKIEDFYVYGNVILYDDREIKHLDFKNYEISVERVEGQSLIGVNILGIEFEIIT